MPEFQLSNRLNAWLWRVDLNEIFRYATRLNRRAYCACRVKKCECASDVNAVFERWRTFRNAYGKRF